MKLRKEEQSALDCLQQVWYTLRKDDNPFGNTGAKFVGDNCTINAYSWNEDDEDQDYPNFKWNDWEVSWYKYNGRGNECNRQLTRIELREMLWKCIGDIMRE